VAAGAAERASGRASCKERLYECRYTLDRENENRMQRIELSPR